MSSEGRQDRKDAGLSTGCSGCGKTIRLCSLVPFLDTVSRPSHGGVGKDGCGSVVRALRCHLQGTLMRTVRKFPGDLRRRQYRRAHDSIT